MYITLPLSKNGYRAIDDFKRFVSEKGITKVDFTKKSYEIMEREDENDVRSGNESAAVYTSG